MLIDPTFKYPHPFFAALARMNDTDGGDGDPRRLATGFYLVTHWNVGDIVTPRPVRSYAMRQGEEIYSPDYHLGIPEYGVCDTPAQFIERLSATLEVSLREHFVSFVIMRKGDQPPSRGWRWHKWGEYIGDRKPQCEYLFDEPEIDQATTFHVYTMPASQRPAP